MLYYNLSCDLNDDCVDKFINWINNYPSNDITIFLNSGGGWVASYRALLNIFDNEKDRITLVANEFIGSCAFELFFTTKCKTNILPSTAGMYHQYSAELVINNNGYVCPQKPGHINSKKSLIEEIEHIKSFVKSIPLTKKERNDIVKGYDVYFTSNRMQELFKNKKNG